MRETLYNQRFDDIYFSPEDGLAETQHVFLSGNDLPARWAGKERFTIVETGFGTGLNFLAAWKLFEETAHAAARLDFISFELYPLHADEIKGALEVWQDALGGRIDRMLALYPLRVPGVHRLQLSERVSLTLVFDDVGEGLSQLTVPYGVDAWFLDGFAPAKNPEMWTAAVYENMKRLSADGASVATFTAAGHVRRGLEEVGFKVQKARGFGRKREMVVGQFEGNGVATHHGNSPKRIAVVGGGLAGTSCAYLLKQAGAEVALFEKEDALAAGASGNMLGLYNPRFYAEKNAQSLFYTSAYARLYALCRAFDDVGFQDCGALHLINSEEKARRFEKLCDQGGWHTDHACLLSKDEASEVAGIAIENKALYLPDSGFVSPRALCEFYARDIDVRLKTPAQTIEGNSVNGEAFDAVVIANAFAAKSFAPLSWLPIHTVRGQISAVSAGNASAKLKTNLCYGGYISAANDGGHVVGSTFQKWLDDTDIRDEDDADNLAKLRENVSSIGDDLSVTGGRAALRTASQDHFPLIGKAVDEAGAVIDNVYLSLAHGSHGLLSSLAGAQILADMILGNPYSLPKNTVDALSPYRFIERKIRKGS